MVYVGSGDLSYTASVNGKPFVKCTYRDIVSTTSNVSSYEYWICPTFAVRKKYAGLSDYLRTGGSREEWDVIDKNGFEWHIYEELLDIGSKPLITSARTPVANGCKKEKTYQLNAPDIKITIRETVTLVLMREPVPTF